MIKDAGISATHRITDEGIEFGFTSTSDADVFRLNIMAMTGDFGAHTHTQKFDDLRTCEEWVAMSSLVAGALDIEATCHIQGRDAVVRFARSEDAVIFLNAIDEAMHSGSPRAGIAKGLVMQSRMTNLRNSLADGPG